MLTKLTDKIKKTNKIRKNYEKNKQKLIKQKNNQREMKTTIMLIILLFLAGCQQTVKEQSTQPEAYFNPENTLSQIMLKELNNSQYTIDCALYNLNIEEIENLLDEKNQL